MPSRRIIIPLAAVVLVIGIGVAWWFVSPLFISQTVDEAFPNAAVAIVPDNMTRDEVEQTMAGIAKVDSEMTEPMPAAGEPVRVTSGAFRDADEFHKGSGQAGIYRLPDGSHLLRLEELNVTNGPDLHVYLVSHPNPTQSSDVHTHVDLGKLKGNVGSQNYPIPADVPIPSQQSVVIYCQPFHVIFSVASLQ